MFSYQTIVVASEGEYKEKGSKFLAKAFPIQNEEEVKEILAQLRKQYYDARHVCYAYILASDIGLIEKANDDGEPAHTAGTPILNQLKSFQLQQTLVVVIRYFGGTKLGVPGLIQAYKSAAFEALQQAKIIEIQHTIQYQITFPYDLTGKISHLFRKYEIEISQDFSSEHVVQHIKMPLKHQKSFLNEINPLLYQISLKTLT
jgi:uncharacterized YigZ family protein